MIDYFLLYSSLCLAVRQAGVIAKALQGKVGNDGKLATQVSPNESELLQARKAAKTVVDEIIQELILIAVLEHISPNTMILDAEEKTPLVAQFGANKGIVSLVIDPIDGTLEYLNGKDSYSVCVAIVENGKMKFALVFFPARDVAYALAPDGKSYIYHQFSTLGVTQSEEITLPKQTTNLVYIDTRLPENIANSLRRVGFEVQSDEPILCPDAMISMIEKGTVACFSTNRQTRDILVGAIIGNVSGAFATDWNGQPIKWPLKGRVEQAIFGNSAQQQKIIEAVEQGME